MCVWILLYLWSKAILTDSKIFLSGFVLLTDIWPTFTCTGVYPIGGTSSYTDVDNDSIAGSSLGGSTMELLQARKNPRGIPGKWNGYLAEEIFGILYSLIFMQCAKYFWLLKFCLLILIVEKINSNIFLLKYFQLSWIQKLQQQNWSAYWCFGIKMQKCASTE